MTRTPDEPRRDLASLVARAAERWPDALALVGDHDRLSWSDVERRTGNLASHLVDRGVRLGDRVAIARQKGSESFEAVHAVLRAGGVVVPVDPGAPPAVAADVLSDADVVAVVGDAATINRLDPWAAVPDLRIVVAAGDTDDPRVASWSELVECGTGTELPTVSPDDRAYLIYTSGSTGRPKGIVHTHRSGWSYAAAAVEVHGLRPDDRIAGMCPLHFDMSTFELYAAPLVGASVVVVADGMMRLFLAEFTELCERERVTVWYTVPFFLRQLTDRGALDRRDLSSLRSVIYAGEPYPPGALGELMSALPHAEVCNAYGPAETNVCTSYVVDRSPAGLDSIPIGRPWPGAEIRIVGEGGELVQGAGVGELSVSAPTVMQEYWGRPDLTTERLTPRPDGPAWYATGDVVERDVHGVLWYRGRRDHQVKVRGVRLELEAVEGVLTDAPGVAHAVACATGASGDAAGVVAAVVERDGEAVDVTALRRWCAQRLAVVAVPQAIAIWPSFPSTASGKIDRSTVRSHLVEQLTT